MIVLLVVVVFAISILISALTLGLGLVGRALVQWLISAAIAPVAALSASVLYFTLRDAAANDGWASS